MHVVFMGTPEFAADILEELAHNLDVVCVYTRPDMVRSRGKKVSASPVKERAQELGIEVRCPITLKDPEEIAFLESLDPDVICVAAYGMILPKTVLDIPRYGCLNVHASLLPRWRGAAPIERAILADDEYVGVCIMRMEEGLDTGDYCVVRRIPIEGKHADELTADLASLGAVALISAITQIEAGNAHWTVQDTDGVTYAEKIAKGELFLDPSADAHENLLRVRASGAVHPARASVLDRDITIEDARELADGPALGMGEVRIDGKRLLLGCANGTLEVLRLKPAGKKSMDAKSFIAGLRDQSDGAHWGRI